jgi:hypothetical protein
MKFATAVILALPMVGAFCPAPSSNTMSRLSMSAVVTGPTGKAAASAADDLALTLQIILDHSSRSSTVSKEQFIQQMEEVVAAKDEEPEEVDISIPYNAAAKLAYEASDKSMSFVDFEPKYLAQAVAEVIAKQPVDISIPYDATAKLAYEASDKSMAYADFKVKYLADAVAEVIAKQPEKTVAKQPEKTVDISIPYDATAKLAYEASDKSMAYADFKVKYLADAVAEVIAKQPVDISIPYDATAKLAYEASDKSMAYADFKVKYLADAVAEVIAKQ